jgi:ribosomal protein S18 acetylase RimI-like enzyme
MDNDAVLALFDAQLRRLDGEQVGPVVRNAGPAGNWIVHSALTTENADEAIAEQQAYFARIGGELEWKYYAYDEPQDLPERLIAAGFVAEPTEALLVADVAELLAGPLADASLPAGVELREVADAAGFEAIVGLGVAVWGAERRGLGRGLAAEYAADPALISIFRVVAPAGPDAVPPGGEGGAGEETVCAAWIRFHPGTEFASLWGGSTLPQWRRRGIYRALVAHRARLAAKRGYRYLQVDASDDSRPILRALGFELLTTTTPYVWTPPPLWR